MRAITTNPFWQRLPRLRKNCELQIPRGLNSPQQAKTGPAGDPDAPARNEKNKGLSGTTAQAAEKCNSSTAAAKARIENRASIAALKRCSTQNQNFSAVCD